MRYTKYPDLMSVLLLAEKHNELLLKHHWERLIETLHVQSHVTYVPTTWFISQGTRRRPKSERMNRTPMHKKTYGACKWPTLQSSQKGRFSELLSTRQFFRDIRTYFKCGTKGHIAKSCKTALHLVNFTRIRRATWHTRHTCRAYEDAMWWNGDKSIWRYWISYHFS